MNVNNIKIYNLNNIIIIYQINLNTLKHFKDINILRI